MNDNKIFVSIACFMDNDILNTINDCLEKAEHPNNIVFGICFQHDPDDDYLKIYDNNPQFRIHKMHWNEARGPAYARGIIFDLFKKEKDDYFFQIDCHTRFFNRWDTKILESFKICKQINPKCVISHYPVNINNINGNLSTLVHIQTVRCVDINHGIKTHGRNLNLKDCPKKSWGTSAAMLFFDKQAYNEVPFDKEIYHGLQFEEQVVIAARYWTYGYDIFTPTQHIISTEYMTSSSRQKVRPQIDRNKKIETYDRLCHIMKLKYNEKYLNLNRGYLGKERTIEDYYKMLEIYDRVKEVFPDNYLDEKENLNSSIDTTYTSDEQICLMYYINLDIRTNRRNEFENEIKKHKLNVTRYPAYYGCADKTKQNNNMTKGHYGCWMSHYKLWEIIKEFDTQCIILEDDIVFAENFKEKLKIILDEAKKLEYDMILLGHNWQRGKYKITNNISTMGEFFGTQGYIITPIGAKKLYDKWLPHEWPGNIDNILSKININKEITIISATERIVILSPLSGGSDTNRG